MKQDGQAGQFGEPELGTHVDGTEGQHARRERCNAKSGHDGSRHCGHASADENLCPLDTRRIKSLASERAHAARLGKRGEWQRFSPPVLPVRRSKPAESFFGKELSIISSDVQANDRSIEFAPVKTLQQVA